MEVEYGSIEELAWSGPLGQTYLSNMIVDPKSMIQDRRKVLEEALDGIIFQTVFNPGVGASIALRALREMRPDVKVTALDISLECCEYAKSWADSVICASCLEYVPSETYDLVLADSLFSAVGAVGRERAYACATKACGRFLYIFDCYAEILTITPYHGATLVATDFAREICTLYNFTERAGGNITLGSGSFHWNLLERSEPPAPHSREA